MQAQLDDVSARSAAAHREYQAALEEMQHTMQSKQDQAADADAQQQEETKQLELEIQQLQVHIVLVAIGCLSWLTACLSCMPCHEDVLTLCLDKAAKAHTHGSQRTDLL